MKLYINSATDVSAIQAKIARKEEDIRKKKQLIDKRNATIDKQLIALKKDLTPEEISRVEAYKDQVVVRGRYRASDENNIWDLHQKFTFAEDPIYKITDAADSIRSANQAIEEYTATLNKYKDQLAKIMQKEKEVDEIPDVLKDFMNQLVDEWDRYDINIRDNSPAYYKELKDKMEEIVPSNAYSKERREILFGLYPEYKERYENSDGYNRYYVDRQYENLFEDTYLNSPFRKKFGVPVQYARSLWDMSDEDIHKENLESGKRIILDLVNRVTKITGPITSWSGLYMTQGNSGWSVLNGIVEGEDGKAKVESILASGPVQRLHVRTLVHKVG